MSFKIWDVVVIGAGPTGISAAISASRNNASTILIDKYGFLGGTVSSGWVAWLTGSHDSKGRQIIKGILQEIIDKLVKMECSDGKVVYRVPNMSTVAIEPEMFQFAAIDLIDESKITFMLHSLATDINLVGSKIDSLVIHNKDGKSIIKGKMFIDATGDADISVFSKVPFEKGDSGSGFMNAMSLIFRVGNVNIKEFTEWWEKNPPIEPYKYLPPLMTEEPSIRKAGYLLAQYTKPEQKKLFISTMSIYKDGTKTKDLNEAEIEARKKVLSINKFLKENVPGFELSFIDGIAPSIGVRETRRIIGDYILSVEDVMTGARFSDVIAKGAFPIDIHHEGQPTLSVLDKDYDIPYRCLIPKNVENLLVGGRCISVEHQVSGTIRITGACMATGQAAGAAAALAALGKKTTREIKIGKLQELLVNQGCILYDKQVRKTNNVM